MSASYKHIQLRRGSLRELDNANPLLKDGEAAFATDAFVLKIGDGKTRWLNLPQFISEKKIQSKKILVDLPQIDDYDSHTIEVDFDGLDTKNEYLVLVQPKTSLPSGIKIDYSYFSDTNQISIQFSYIPDAIVLDGGVPSGSEEGFSSAVNNIVLYAIAYTVVEPPPIVETTESPTPIAGEAYSFGNNQFGQLALSNNDDHYNPILIDDVAKWKVLSAGHYHTAGITNDYELLTAGYNYYGQLGLGDKEHRNSFTRVHSTYALNSSKEEVVYSEANSKFRKVEAGANNTSAIDDRGQLFTTGLNSYGSLGHGDKKDRSNLILIRSENAPLLAPFDHASPTLLQVIGNKYFFPEAFSNFPNCSKFQLDRHGIHKLLLDSTTNSGHAFALLNGGIEDHISYSGEYFIASGTVTGTARDGDYPFYSGEIYIDVSGDYGKVSAYSLDFGYAGGEELFHYKNPHAGWADVSNGQQHTLAIREGKLYSFGNNTFGQLGNGDRTNKNTPTLIEIPNEEQTVFTKSVAGNYHSLAIDTSGNAWSFGQNDHGQLGHSNTQDKLVPTKVDLTNYSLDNYIVENFEENSFVNFVNNKYVFGLTFAGEDKEYQERERYLLSIGTYNIYNVPSSYPITILNNGISDSISISGSQLGNSEYEVVGTPNDGTYNFYWGDVTITVHDNFDIASIYSVSHNRAGTEDHSGYYGGDQLFYYSKSNKKFVDISAGNNYSLFKTEDNKVYACGSNEYGQLGQGNNRDYYSLVEVEGEWEEISAGSNHVLLTDVYRDLWSFGNNERGQLGLGDTINRSHPTKLRNDFNWTLPSAGGTHSIVGLKSYYPQKPLNIQAKNSDNSLRAGNYELEISWFQPDSLIDGIQYYIVEVSVDGGDFNALPYTRSDDPPQYYILKIDQPDTLPRRFRVKSVNSFGESEYSEISNSIVATQLIDPDFCNTVFLTHFDGDVTGETSEIQNFFRDYSKNAYQYTVNISVTPVSTLGGKFGSALNPYTPTNVRYTLSDAASLTEDFTIEFFIKPTSIEGSRNLLRIEDNLNVRNVQGRVVVDGYENEMLSSELQELELDTWSHIAWVRSGVNNSLFVNFKRVDTLSESIVNSYTFTNKNLYFEQGLIDEVRISNIARYSTDFSELDQIGRPFGEGSC